MVSHEDGLSPGPVFNRGGLVSHQDVDGLSSGWSIFMVVSDQDGLSRGWSFPRANSHRGGLVSPQDVGGLSS